MAPGSSIAPAPLVPGAATPPGAMEAMASVEEAMIFTGVQNGNFV
jgi:hypothetical protein